MCFHFWIGIWVFQWMWGCVRLFPTKLHGSYLNHICIHTHDIDYWYIHSLIQIPMLDSLGRNVHSFSPYITSNCSQRLESPTQFAFRWWLAMLHSKWSTHNLETPIYGVPHLLWFNKVGVAWSYSTNKILYASSVGEGMVENCGPQFTPTFHTKKVPPLKVNLLLGGYVTHDDIKLMMLIFIWVISNCVFWMAFINLLCNGDLGSSFGLLWQ